MNLLTLLSLAAFLRLLCVLFFISLTHRVFSQIETNTLRGTVIDSATNLPIPQVNIWTNHSNTISDAEGNFSLFVPQGDTVHFSHVSYHGLIMKHDSNIPATLITIALTQKIRLLSEVQVYSYLSETDFRQKIIQTTPVLTREEEIVQINSKIINYMYRYAPTFPMNANDNYIEYMKGPQPVVIFSSKPSKGLVRAIKNVLTPSQPSYKKFFNSDSLVRGFRYH